MVPTSASRAEGDTSRCVEFHDEDGKRYQCHRRVGHRGPHHADSGRAWGGRRRRLRTRARHYTDCPGRGGFVGIAAVFFPGTWVARLIALAAVIFSATGPFPALNYWASVRFYFSHPFLTTGPFTGPRPLNGILLLSSLIGLFAGALLVASKIEVPHWIRKHDNFRWYVGVLLRTSAMSLWVLAVFGGGYFLAFLAANGATSERSYSASVSGLMWRAGVVVLCGGFESGREPCVAVEEVAESVELADVPFGGGGQVGLGYSEVGESLDCPPAAS